MNTASLVQLMTSKVQAEFPMESPEKTAAQKLLLDRLHTVQAEAIVEWLGTELVLPYNAHVHTCAAPASPSSTPTVPLE